MQHKGDYITFFIFDSLYIFWTDALIQCFFLSSRTDSNLPFLGGGFPLPFGLHLNFFDDLVSLMLELFFLLYVSSRPVLFLQRGVFQFIRRKFEEQSSVNV